MSKKKKRKQRLRDIVIPADKTYVVEGIELNSVMKSLVFSNPDFQKPRSAKERIHTVEKNNNVNWAFWENKEFTIHGLTTVKKLKVLATWVEKRKKYFKKNFPQHPTAFWVHFGNISFFVTD